MSGARDSTTTALLENTETARPCYKPDQPCDKALACQSVLSLEPPMVYDVRTG